jgi:hypothetical protein
MQCKPLTCPLDNWPLLSSDYTPLLADVGHQHTICRLPNGQRDAHHRVRACMAAYAVASMQWDMRVLN